MQDLNTILLNELPYFKECINKFQRNEMPNAEFKGISGGFGVYAHRDHSHFMIRLRLSCGVLSLDKLKTIYNLAKKYGLHKIHLTTRQAIQLHDLSGDEVTDLIEESLNNNIYTRGSGGNFPRNVAMSPLSSVDPLESFDITPYALAVDNHFIRKIYTYKLPRKLKVSFSNSCEDTAHATVQDLGFIGTSFNGENYFKVFLGGGLGRNPAKGIEYPELVYPKDVLYHVEAMTKLFINEGNYENKGKARVRYIVEKLGKEKFLQEYNRYLEEEKTKGNLDLIINTEECAKPGIEINLTHPRLIEQKQQGLYGVYFHPIGGQLSLKDFKLLIDNLNSVDNLLIRSTMTEGLYFLNLNGNEANKLLKLTENLGGETSLEQSVSCIGVPICQMGILESQKMLNDIISYFRKNNFSKDILPKIYISGCPNSCGVHEIGSIGLCGKKKKINDVLTDVFELYIGGKLHSDGSSLAEYYGDIPSSMIPKLLYEIACNIEESKMTFHDYINNHNDNLRSIINNYSK